MRTKRIYPQQRISVLRGFPPRDREEEYFLFLSTRVYRMNPTEIITSRGRRGRTMSMSKVVVAGKRTGW